MPSPRYKKLVVLDFEIVGFHFWPEAIPQVDFLKYPHRHIFQIRVHIEVKHNNRQKEIFIETEKLQNYISNVFGTPANFENMSCEAIAEHILEYGSSYDYTKVEVYEDGKGGAIVQYDN